MDEKPYSFSKEHGTLSASSLRDYATWLFPKLEVEWESPGVERRAKPGDAPKTKGKPYTFRKSVGWLNVQKDIRPFAAFVVAKLKVWSSREPYVPARSKGMALMSDLIEFDDYTRRMLAKKKAEQSKK